MHPDAVAGPFHHGGRDTHAVDVRVFVWYAYGSFFPAEIVDAEEFPILCLIADPGNQRADPAEAYTLRQTQGMPASDRPVHMFLRQEVQTAPRMVVPVHILYFAVSSFFQRKFLRVIRNAEIRPSVVRPAVRNQKRVKMACQTAQELPVAFFILEQKIRDHRPARDAVHDLCIRLVLQHFFHDLPIGGVQVLEAPADRPKAPVHGMGERGYFQHAQPALPNHLRFRDLSPEQNSLLFHNQFRSIHDAVDRSFQPLLFCKETDLHGYMVVKRGVQREFLRLNHSFHGKPYPKSLICDLHPVPPSGSPAARRAASSVLFFPSDLLCILSRIPAAG